MASQSRLFQESKRSNLKYQCIPQLLDIPSFQPICRVYDNRWDTNLSGVMLYDTEEECNKQCHNKQTARALLEPTLKFLGDSSFAALFATSKQTQQDKKLVELKQQRQLEREAAEKEIFKLRVENKLNTIVGKPEWRKYADIINPHISLDKWLEILKNPDWPISRDQMHIPIWHLIDFMPVEFTNELLSGRVRHFNQNLLSNIFKLLSKHYTDDQDLTPFVNSFLDIIYRPKSTYLSVNFILGKFLRYLYENPEPVNFNSNLLTSLLKTISKRQDQDKTETQYIVEIPFKESKDAIEFLNEYGLTNMLKMTRNQLINFVMLTADIEISDRLRRELVNRLLELGAFDAIYPLFRSLFSSTLDSLSQRQKNAILAKSLLPSAIGDDYPEIALRHFLNEDNSKYLFQLYFGILNEYFNTLPSANKEWLKKQIDLGLHDFNRYVHNWSPLPSYKFNPKFMDYLINEYQPSPFYFDIYDVLIGNKPKFQ